METPCQWAAKAINDKGQEFKLSMDGKSVNAPLSNAQKMDIGGGYIAYQFSWVAPVSPEAPQEDGIYMVSSPGTGEAELFLVYNAAGSQGHWAASVTCEGS